MWVRGLGHQVVGLGLGSQVIVNIAVREHLGDVSCIGAIHIDITFTFLYLYLESLDFLNATSHT